MSLEIILVLATRGGLLRISSPQAQVRDYELVATRTQTILCSMNTMGSC